MKTTVTTGASSTVRIGGRAVIAMVGGVLGGYVTNPLDPSDQGLAQSEVLYVDPTGPAATGVTGTTLALQPGDTYQVPSGTTLPIWVNSASSGHKFTAVAIETPTQALAKIVGAFPPATPSFTEVIRAYLYQQYTDDDDLQTFFAAFNGLAQDYLDTFNALNLPVYTGPLIVGALLDWVGAGLYGMPRPALSSGRRTYLGPLNTYEFNTQVLNRFRILEPADITVTNDDVYRRILTWHIYKGDGKVFNIRWLKRRIMRFLLGSEGSAPPVPDTSQVSITFGPNSEVSIRLLDSIAMIERGAILNTFLMNRMTLNNLVLGIQPLTPLPNRAIFKEAVDSGVLELPFQFSYVVTI